MKSSISIISHDTSVAVEKNQSDLAISDWLEMFTACMIAVSFPKETIANGMQEFAEELQNKIN